MIMTRPTRNRQMLSESAYEAIKWLVLNSELPVGRLFSVAELCGLVDMGRAPVSHAVLRLHEERLVDVLPRKGIMVKAWSPEGFADILTVRSPLEETSVRLAAEKATPEHVTCLKAIISKETVHLQTLNRRELRGCDTELHLAIARISGNGILSDEISYLHHLSASAWYSHVSGKEAFERSHAQHEAIVASIAAGDPDGAVQAMRFHLQTVGGGTPTTFSNYKPLRQII